MDGPWWLDRAVSVLVIGGGCALGVASLLVIAWVGWMLADPGRAVDYRRRVDAALHGRSDGRTRWLAAVRGEATFAAHLMHDGAERRRRPGGDSLRP